jgi:hypothetical protein
LRFEGEKHLTKEEGFGEIIVTFWRKKFGFVFKNLKIWVCIDEVYEKYEEGRKKMKKRI